jgi:MFS family permease
LWVPESPRWLEATQTAPVQPLRELGQPGLRRTTLVATILCGVTLIGTWGLVQWLPLWADQLTHGAAPQAKAWTQAWSALGAISGCFLGAWLANLCGRRLAYFLLCLASLGVCLVFFAEASNYGSGFLAFTFATGFVTASFYGLIPLYLPELFPTRVRATGQGIAYNAGRVLAAVGALQMGALMAYLGNSYARAGEVLSLVYVFGLIVVWFAPETKGRPLPD